MAPGLEDFNDRYPLNSSSRHAVGRDPEDRMERMIMTSLLLAKAILIL